MLFRLQFLVLSLFCVAVASAQTFDPKKVKSQHVDPSQFVAKGDLEVTLWANSPMFFNPTNIDIDKDGRIWVAEGVRYRRNHERRPAGDRIMVLEDQSGNGRADRSHVFVQDEALVAPLGIAVIDNLVVVSQPPDLIVYTDVDRNRKFDPAVDKREILLTGFNGKNHDHSLHSITVGPDSKWYWNSGNCGAKFTDNDGKTWNICSDYAGNPIGPWTNPNPNTEVAGKPSADGHVYVGGFAVRMNPNGTGVEVIGHNFRNSYEQSVTSFGDVFQNDNDDPPACRVSWVMEYANFGFSSNDGTRSWRADQRPGQSIPVAEWRQEDPGIYPAGDVYGGGSPTGNVFYENGALGSEFEGMFLACEPGRNTIFGYKPEPKKAGFELERFDFLTTNPTGEFAGSDFLGGSNSVSDDIRTLFRPSDIAVGPDGALYVSDWYDGRVGGHQDLDESCSGAIYRIAPKGFRPQVPDLKLNTMNGAIQALRSPAVNVRELGRKALREKGPEAFPALEEQLRDSNPFLATRAVWVMAQMGREGQDRVEALLKEGETHVRIAAFRALRGQWFEQRRLAEPHLESEDQEKMREARKAWARQELKLLVAVEHFTKDPDPAIRREAALALRDVEFNQCRDALCRLAKAYESGDRFMLEAIGTASIGKERAAYKMFCRDLKGKNPLTWSQEMADLAWRLHSPDAVEAHQIRASSPDLTYDERKQALDALAFTKDQTAAYAALEVAALEGENPLKADATWWLLNRANNDWKEYGIRGALKERGIYDPAKIEIMEAVLPKPGPIPTVNYPPLAELLTMTGDPVNGKTVAQRCIMCHQVEGQGVSYGPALDGWGKTQTREVIFQSIVDPSASIAHGFKGTEIITKDGKTIHGLVISNGDPKMIRSMGGLTQTIPKNRIQSEKGLGRSLMLSAAQLGISTQDLVDLVAYLKAN